jgi:hypothetical protein
MAEVLEVEEENKLVKMSSVDRLEVSVQEVVWILMNLNW